MQLVKQPDGTCTYMRRVEEVAKNDVNLKEMSDFMEARFAGIPFLPHSLSLYLVHLYLFLHFSLPSTPQNNPCGLTLPLIIFVLVLLLRLLLCSSFLFSLFLRVHSLLPPHHTTPLLPYFLLVLLPTLNPKPSFFLIYLFPVFIYLLV